jgi:hypothetical protein
MPRLRRLLPVLALIPLLGGCVGVYSPGVEGTATGSVVTPGVAPGYGYQCFAGFYQCRMAEQMPLGTQCSCPGIGAPSFGTIR